MAMSEAQRLQLFDHYKAHLGEPLAEALMTTVPPFDWHEIATKADIARLEAATSARFEHLEGSIEHRFDKAAADTRTGFAEVRIEIERINSTVAAAVVSQTRWTLGYVTTLCGIALAVAKWWV